MYYSVSGAGAADARLMRVCFSKDEWKRIRRAENARNRRLSFAFLLLGLAVCAAALFLGVHGVLKWLMLAAGALCILLAVPGKEKNGLDSDGNVTDRAALDRYVSARLRAYCQGGKKPVTVTALPDEESDSDPQPECENVPLSAFLRDGKGGSHRTWAVCLPVMAVLAAICFFLWRANVAGGLISVLSIAALAFAAAALLAWAAADTKAGRAAALIACVFLLFIGGMKLYTAHQLIPAALETAGMADLPAEGAGTGDALLLVRESENDGPRVVYLPLCDPKTCAVIAVAGTEYLADTAYYGTSGNVKGYAYGCEVVLYDGKTRECLARLAVETQLPGQISSSPGASKTFETHPTDAQILRRVREWIKQNLG